MSRTGDRLDVADLGTILGVWAHPDDEGYLSAGLMAAAIANGQRVVLAHATLGEHGTDDPIAFPPDRMRDIRRRELDTALHTLGVTEHHYLGIEDGVCDRLDRDLGAAQVAAVIEAVRPDTIVTFGPDGITGHPDHRAVAAWTADAWSGAGRPGHLLHAAVTTRWARRHRALHEQIGAFFDGFPLPVEESALALSLHLDPETLDRKLDALCCHASQTRPLIAEMGVDTYRTWFSSESFVEAPAVLT